MDQWQAKDEDSIREKGPGLVVQQYAAGFRVSLLPACGAPVVLHVP